MAASDSHNFAIGRNAVSTTVQIEWTTPGVVCIDPNKQLAGQSAQGATTSEQTTVPNPAAGAWTAEARGWLSATEQYKGTATVEYILE